MSVSADDLLGGDLPARLERLHLIAKRMAFRGRRGVRRSRGVGDGLEFADHRDYSPGDDPRFIDWSCYARMEKLLVRLFHTHSEAPVALLLDVSASMSAPDTSKFIYALRTAAALTYIAMGGMEQVLLLPFSDRLHRPLVTGRNRLEIPRVLEFLASMTAGGRSRFGHCAEQFARSYASVGSALLVSDLCDMEGVLSGGLARLAGSGRDLAVIHVTEPPSLRQSGPAVLEDAETGRELLLELSEETIRSAGRRHRQWQGDCEAICRSRGAVYVHAPTDLAFERLVLYCLARAGLVSA
ncbi:MAG: DUF58 domain-containing protein [Phycisphaerae bacterium]